MAWAVADGLSNREIAERLGIGEPTVRTHVTDILRVLQVEGGSERVRLARWVLLGGLEPRPRWPDYAIRAILRHAIV